MPGWPQPRHPRHVGKQLWPPVLEAADVPGDPGCCLAGEHAAVLPGLVTHRVSSAMDVSAPARRIQGPGRGTRGCATRDLFFTLAARTDKTARCRAARPAASYGCTRRRTAGCTGVPARPSQVQVELAGFGGCDEAGPLPPDAGEQGRLGRPSGGPASCRRPAPGVPASRRAVFGLGYADAPGECLSQALATGG
jgi:hypothetical protein